ncbi:Cilia- and flagella-associated protein 57 [Desmophyllum pertusum]|uniref:Cilia- and flagella-associated protein 57 n=1 Tax=Desmophyllum pertusum TaxID=174260 RepID=A0A9W9ZUQ5_9CNID|nr:Cilia- and flagella-associated protein 57 [Desmophyllum pertusum]
MRFTFTNDDLYFVYSSEDSLHALSLQTGTIFTSVSGCNVFYFTRERQSLLTTAGPLVLHVKNRVFSPDGKLMAIHQGTKDSRNDQHFYVWDIQEKVMSASFKSPALFTVECLLPLIEYRAYLVRQCTISLDNQLLVCCIANTILVYSVHDPDVNSSKRVLRGHLGRIEFCRFLKVNRYLISYGVDGMVFLWDISESKVAWICKNSTSARKHCKAWPCPRRRQSRWFSSSGRVCTIKLCELAVSLSLKPLMEPAECKMEIAETSLHWQSKSLQHLRFQPLLARMTLMKMTLMKICTSTT